MATTNKPDTDAITYLFQDMAEANGSQDTRIDSVQSAYAMDSLAPKFEQVLGAPQTFHLSRLQGLQNVVPNKRPGEPAKTIRLSMALFRFKPQEADFLVTLNTEEHVDSAQADALFT